MKKVLIESHTMYDSLYPSRKLIGKEVLTLVKTLRQEGYEVSILPEGSTFEYLFIKGETSFLSDPATLLVVGIPITIATTLVTNWLQKLIDKKGKDEKPNNIFIKDAYKKQTTTYSGEQVEEDKILNLKSEINNISIELQQILKTQSPFPGLPTPILLEHQPIIAGWCRLDPNDKGIFIDKAIITDDEIYNKIKTKELAGASITGIAKKSICNICSNNYTECIHISGQEYDGISCVNRIVQADFIEVSIVSKPINPAAVIHLV